MVTIHVTIRSISLSLVAFFLIELDDGKFLTGKPQQFDVVKTHGFPVKIFPSTNPG